MNKKKKCKRCERILPIKLFYEHKEMPSGYLNFCKECTKKRIKNHRLKNIDKIKEYERNRNSIPQRVKARRKYQKTKAGKVAIQRARVKYRIKYPEKYRAKTVFGHAIRSGKIKRKPCEKCGKLNAQGHHADYSKPLDVQWLCVFHHLEAHNFHRGPRKRNLKFNKKHKENL